MNHYWSPAYWGVALVPFVQTANVNLAIEVAGDPRMLDPRDLVPTNSFTVLNSAYRDGKLITTIEFTGV